MSEDDNKPAANESITFRIDKQVLDKIRKYAEYDSMTLNAAANQIMSHAVDWAIPAARAGWVPIPKMILMSIIDNLDESTIQRIASDVGKTVPKDMLFIMRGEIGVNQWVSVLRSRAKASGFSYQEEETQENIKIITKHDMGYKWSIWFKAFYKSYFEQLGCPVKFTFTDNTIVYEIPK